MTSAFLRSRRPWADSPVRAIPASPASHALQEGLAASLTATRALVGYTAKEFAAEVAELLPDLTYRKLKAKEYGEARIFAHELLAFCTVLGPLDSWVVPAGEPGEILKRFRAAITE